MKWLGTTASIFYREINGVKTSFVLCNLVADPSYLKEYEACHTDYPLFSLPVFVQDAVNNGKTCKFTWEIDGLFDRVIWKAL